MPPCVTNRFGAAQHVHLRHIVADQHIRGRLRQQAAIDAMTDRHHDLIRLATERLEARAIERRFVAAHRAHRHINQRPVRRPLAIAVRGGRRSDERRERRSGEHITSVELFAANLKLAGGADDVQGLTVAEIVDETRDIDIVVVVQTTSDLEVAAESHQPVERQRARRAAVEMAEQFSGRDQVFVDREHGADRATGTPRLCATRLPHTACASTSR